MPRKVGNSDDFLPGLSPRAIGVFAGVLAWAATGLLVQGVGTVFWVLLRVVSGNDSPFSSWPTWLLITLGLLIHLGILVAAIDVGRRVARWVTERRNGSSAAERSAASD